MTLGKLASLNVKGIGNRTKQKIIAKRLSKCDVIALQETHLTSHTLYHARKAFSRFDLYTSQGTSQARGSAILVSKSLNYTIIPVEGRKVYTDQNGRVCAITISVAEEHIGLVSVYAPNLANSMSQVNEYLRFLTGLDHTLQTLKGKTQKLVVAGDFNMILDKHLDARGGEPRIYQECREYLLNILDKHCLIDSYRISHPTQFQYTYSPGGRNLRKIYRRLDYIFIERNLWRRFGESSTQVVPRTDHKMISVEKIEHITENKGRGLWRHNDDLNYDPQFIELIKQELKEVNSTEFTSHTSKWEYIKYRLRMLSRRTSKIRAKEAAKEKQEKTAKLNAIDGLIINDRASEEDIEEYNQLKQSLDEIENKEMEKLIFRSRVEWYEKGEKCTNYYMRIIKENSKLSNITKLETNKGEITDPGEILKEATRFYSKLYNDKDPHIDAENIMLKDENFTQIADTDRDNLEKSITLNELYKALSKMKDKKAPGNDGLTVALYKTIWPDIREAFHKAAVEAIEKQELPPSMRQGVIRLIEKKGKDRTSLDNWRPISLLNVDYKIISKAIALRLENLLPKIINGNQLAFVPNRLIYEGVRKTQYIMECYEKTKRKLAVMNIDFKKAFDTVKHNYLWMILGKYNFGPKFINTIKTLYQKAESTVINNGTTGSYFPITKSCRQGDCMSPALFILAIEPLLNAVRQDQEIKGAKTPTGTEIKLSAFADDVTLYLRNGASIKRTLNLLTQFQKVAGLEINKKKTELLKIGVWYETFHELKETDAITVTGITLNRKGESVTELNEVRVLKKLEKLIDSWRCRGISLKGRVMLAKSCGLSQIQYLANCLPLSREILRKINKLLYSFIWKGRDKIKRTRTAKTYEEGGLKFPNAEDVALAASVQWVRYATDTDNDWKEFLYHDLNKLGGPSVLNGYLQIDMNNRSLLNFNKYLINNMAELQKLAKDNISRILNHPIQCSNILSKPNLRKKREKEATKTGKWLAKEGIKQIKDMINENNEMIPANEALRSKISNHCSAIEWAAIVRNIPRDWINKLKETPDTEMQPDLIWQYRGQSSSICNNSKQKDITKWIAEQRPTTEPKFI